MPGRSDHAGKTKAQLVKELRESEKQYRDLAELSSNAAIVQVDGRIAFSNQNACRMFGAASTEDLVGIDALRIVAPEARDFVVARWRQALAGVGPLPISETRHQRLDGRAFPSDMITGPVVWQGRRGTMNIIHDISDRKATMAALEESEKRYRELTEGSIMGIAIVQDDRIAYVNPSAVALLGYPIEEIIGRNTDQIVAPEHIDMLNERRQKRLRGEEVAERHEYLIRRKDGGRVWLEQLAQVMTWQGRPAVQVTITDISERKAAEAALKTSEERLGRIVEATFEGIYIHDQGRVLDANQRLAEILGYDIDELMGMDAFDFAAPEVRQRIRQLVTEDFAGTYESVALRKDGTRIPIEISARSHKDGERTLRYVALRDVTERKHAEAALVESEQRFRTIAEGSPIPLLITGRLNGIIRYANPQAGAVLGLPAADLPGRQVQSLFWHPDEREGVLANLDERGFLTGMPLQMRRADGSRISTVHSLQTLLYGGEDVILGSFQDVTEQLQMEEQLRQAQRMEAVGQLTGGVAHDFNNLLAVVLGNAELLERSVDAASAKQQRALASILRAAKRGAELTQRLLAFSRKQLLEPKVVDLNDWLPGIHEMLHRTLGETIELKTLVADGLWRCEVDPGQLDNAVLNLAINARDAMPAGGELTIETSNIVLDENYAAAQTELEPGEYVVLAVSDNGCGMTAETLEHVFDPFFTTKETGKGTGLGLSMVFGFAKQSGGHVSIYSEFGIGTTVRMYLPRAPQDCAAEVAVDTAALPESRGETVLVVEDDSDVRALAATLLASLGYGVLQATDGPSALRILEEAQRIDLLLTDVVLPGGLSGPEIATRATESVPGIKVLYMSGYAENAIVHHGRLDDGVTLLQKPFHLADLAHKVRAALV